MSPSKVPLVATVMPIPTGQVYQTG
jgi:hypothetical protein